MFRRKTAGPIGCEVSEHRVRLVQVHGSASQPTCVTVAERPWSDEGFMQGDDGPSSLGRTIREALREGRFVGRDVVLSLPAGRLSYRRLRLAPMPDEELAQAVHWRVARELGVSAGQIQSGYYDAGQIEEQSRRFRDVIAVTVSKPEVDALAQAVIYAGLTPLAVDASPGALARVLALGSRLVGPSLVVEVGQCNSSLIVVHEGRPCFIRTIPGGRRQIVLRTASRLGLDAGDQPTLWSLLDGQAQHQVDDATLQVLCEMAMLHAAELAHESKLCTHYMAELNGGAYQPLAGCVIGAGAQEEIFLARLGDACDVSFEPLSGLLLPGLSGQLDDAVGAAAADSWLTAVGLALRHQHHVITTRQEVAA